MQCLGAMCRPLTGVPECRVMVMTMTSRAVRVQEAAPAVGMGQVDRGERQDKAKHNLCLPMPPYGQQPNGRHSRYIDAQQLCYVTLTSIVPKDVVLKQC